MDSNDGLNTLRQRAYRHTLEDGIGDIAVGFYTLTVAVATQNRALIPLAVTYLLIYAMGWQHIHQQFSSRRIGHVELPDAPARTLLVGTLAAMVLAMIVVAAVTLASGKLWNVGHWPKWSPVLAGLVLGGGFLHTAMRTGLGRYYGYAGAALAGSLFFWLFPFGPRIDPSDRLTLFLFALAGVNVLGGIAVLARFARTRPVVIEERRDGR